MTEIYLMRHTSVDVPPGTCYGQSDVGLKDSFLQEAVYSRSLLHGLTFDKVYTSPLKRCVRLAAYCGYPDAIQVPELMEMNFGRWEMVKYEDIHDDVIESWYKDYFRVRVPEGESFTDLYLRVTVFLDRICQNNYRRVLLFTHAGVAACALLYARQAGKEDVFSRIPGYGEMIRIDI